ncbi:MAG: hypothetical protein ACRDBY_10155 [Cetobacterium sp.]
MIELNPHEKYYLDGKFFLITKGKVITKDILSNGKVISNENCLRKGEIIGNFFTLLKYKYLYVPEIDVEFEKMLSQLIKKSTIKFLYQFYDKKGIY